MDPRIIKDMPTALALPLRDLLQGMRTAANLSEELLGPAGRLMPPPLRDVLKDTLEAAERVGKRTMERTPPSAEDMAAVGTILSGETPPSPLEREVANVLGYGLEHALAATPDDHLMISELVTSLSFASALARPKLTADPARNAATAALALSEAHAAGTVPGTGFALGEDAEQRINRAIFAVMMWLLTDRPEHPEDEARLLALSTGLAQASAKDVEAAFHDPETLTSQLAQLAAMI